MKILVGGDFFVDDKFKDKLLLSEGITEFFQSFDSTILNQESPITRCGKRNKIIKTGPHLKTSESTIIPVLQALNINLVTLANNHIMDYGSKGLEDTLDSLINNNISYTGVGKNSKEACKPFSLQKNGMSVGIINFAENEWASASDFHGGASPMDVIENVKQIKTAKENHDKVICIIHGGHEYYNLPSPRMQKQYRFYAENGADLIICHHPHCISGYEIYNQVPIYYSLGNFLFTKQSSFDDWYLGLILEINICKDGKLNTVLHPVKQSKTDFYLELVKNEEKHAVLERVSNYSQIIRNEKFLHKHWQIFIEKNSNAFLNLWSPISFITNRYLKAILYKTKIPVLLSSRYGNALKLNLIRCEAHADLSKEILAKRTKS
ncbi:hypothetical protein GCM10007103_29190 [Salinimicrobium marinum]|uniref:Capsule synthesis protein CapA domain-containing protein n=1 Tax=Salinimicrobium marinum TaxID=680283 RepID=A0A918SJD1_9FLAO|nr:CapA family protein [Salinimicrobium marinum]GHA46243.1 hypothetical protein GCM10007103_29190 [Salinimicrobium marinum]